jgi:hypothetical protein
VRFRGVVGRFVAWAKRQSHATVLLVVPAGMTRLSSSLPGADRLVEAPAPRDGFDQHIRLGFILTVPGCDVTAANLWDGPYLQAEPSIVAHWQPTCADGHVVHIGLHWQAAKTHLLAQERSLTLEQLSPLFTIPGATFYSLQYGASAEVAQYPQVVDLGSIDDAGERFVQTCGVLAHVDRAITCDSSLTHLAGALGVRTWRLLADTYDTQCGRERLDTPRYARHYIYQRFVWDEEGENWAPLVELVRSELEQAIWHGLWPEP